MTCRAGTGPVVGLLGALCVGGLALPWARLAACLRRLARLMAKLLLVMLRFTFSNVCRIVRWIRLLLSLVKRRTNRFRLACLRRQLTLDPSRSRRILCTAELLSRSLRRLLLPPRRSCPLDTLLSLTSLPMVLLVVRILAPVSPTLLWSTVTVMFPGTSSTSPVFLATTARMVPRTPLLVRLLTGTVALPSPLAGAPSGWPRRIAYVRVVVAACVVCLLLVCGCGLCGLFA